MKKICVIGWPIGQSRSPIIHNFWMKHFGIESSYEKLAIEPGKAADFIRSLPQSEFMGCNVTIPHKEQAFSAVALPDRKAKRLGVVNTVYMKDGELCGTNTDGEGFIAGLKAQHPQFQLAGCRAVVMGAGGAARAIIGALCDEGAQKIEVRNRTFNRIAELQASFGSLIHRLEDERLEEALAHADLLVNTTSLGMTNQPPLELDIGALQQRAIVADIIYAPLATPLLVRAEKRGNPTLGGLGMLLHQAVRGFELWFGRRPEVTPEIYELVAADVRRTSER